MILVVRGTNGAVTLHRTYLNHKGGKAQVEEPKKLCSGIDLLNGHYVDVCEGIENCRIIAVGEGFETMAGVSIAHGYLVKVRSYINANELARAQGITPADFDKVIIYEDHDKLCPRRNVRPGNHAGAQLQSRLLQLGFAPSQIVRRSPKVEKTDWLDVWQDATSKMGNFLGKLAYQSYLNKSDDPFGIIEKMLEMENGA